VKERGGAPWRARVGSSAGVGRSDGVGNGGEQRVIDRVGIVGTARKDFGIWWKHFLILNYDSDSDSWDPMKCIRYFF